MIVEQRFYYNDHDQRVKYYVVVRAGRVVESFSNYDDAYNYMRDQNPRPLIYTEVDK